MTKMRAIRASASASFAQTPVTYPRAFFSTALPRSEAGLRPNELVACAHAL